MSVSDSVQKGHGHRSDQGRVWAEVAELQRARRVLSPTGAMEDTFDSCRDQLTDLRKRFGYVEGACGVAVALGKQIISLDLFDKPSTCRKVWDRMLSGALLESLSPEASDDQAGIAYVESFIADLGTAPWEAARSPGEGQEFRGATEHGSQASALCYADRIVHGSAVAPGQN